MKDKKMKILWINPVGTELYDKPISELLNTEARAQTKVDIVSLPEDRPSHLEYHSYEALVTADIVNITYGMNKDYDAIVIGCFYDLALKEAREVSGSTPVLAPCQSSLVFAEHLGNSFSILVGRRKWISKMEENVIKYGRKGGLASMRPLELGVHDFQKDPSVTESRMLEAGRRAIAEDGAEVLILGCTIEFGFYKKMQEELGVPVIDAVLAPLKLAEALAETGSVFGWKPSRMWGSEAPPQTEIDDFGLFKGDLPIGNFLKSEDL
jgi:allantoin racemase